MPNEQIQGGVIPSGLLSACATLDRTASGFGLFVLSPNSGWGLMLQSPLPSPLRTEPSSLLPAVLGGIQFHAETFPSDTQPGESNSPVRRG